MCGPINGGFGLRTVDRGGEREEKKRKWRKLKFWVLTAVARRENVGVEKEVLYKNGG
jgi:hypothetical protein